MERSCSRALFLVPSSQMMVSGVHWASLLHHFHLAYLPRGQWGGVKGQFKWYQFVETARLGKVLPSENFAYHHLLTNRWPTFAKSYDISNVFDLSFWGLGFWGFVFHFIACVTWKHVRWVFCESAWFEPMTGLQLSCNMRFRWLRWSNVMLLFLSCIPGFILFCATVFGGKEGEKSRKEEENCKKDWKSWSVQRKTQKKSKA